MSEYTGMKGDIDNHYNSMEGAFGADPYDQALTDVVRLNRENESLEDELERLQQQIPQWISVEDKLPPNDELVLAAASSLYLSDRMVQFIGWYDRESEEWYLMGIDSSYKVSHWQPRPDDPEIKG